MNADLPTEIWLEIAAFTIVSDGAQLRSLSSLSQTCKWLWDVCTPIINTHMKERLKKSSIPNVVLPQLQDLTSYERQHGVSTLDKFHLGRSYQLLRFEIAHNDRISSSRPIQYFVCHARSIQAVEVELVGKLGVTDATRALASLVNLSAQCTGRIIIRENSDRRKIVRGCGWIEEVGPFKFRYQSPSPAGGDAKEDNSSTITATPAVDDRDTREYRKLSALLSGSFRSMKKAREGRMLPPPPGSWFIEPNKPQCIVPIPPGGLALQLTSLDISAEELFSASMYPWTHHLIKTAPLKHLSISILLTATHWEHILPTFTLQHLEHLALFDVPISFPHLLAFLNRHPSLKILELSNRTNDNSVGEVAFSKAYLHPAFLPSLERLIATPEWILPFLENSESTSLPSLMTYDLRSCFYDRYPHGGPSPGACGRTEDRSQYFYPIFERIASLSNSSEFNPDELKPQGTRLRALHLKLYSMSLTALVEWFLLDSDRKDPQSNVSFLANIRTITLVYTNGWLPPPVIMHLIRPWVTKPKQLAKAFAQGKGMFRTVEGVIPDQGGNVEIHAQKDVWMLSLFLCYAFPNLETIISEYRGWRHEVEVDRSLFET